mgnify:CR=1 FL=1
MIKQHGGIFGRNPVFNSIDASQWIGLQLLQCPQVVWVQMVGLDLEL